LYPCLMDVRCEQFVIMWIYDVKNVIMKFVNLPDAQLHLYVKVCIGCYNVNGRRNWRNSQDIYFLRPISNEGKISRICSSIISTRSSNLFLFRCYNIAYMYCQFKIHQIAWRTHGLFLKKTIVCCLKTVTWCDIV
jgi:hypothetical protein